MDIVTPGRPTDTETGLYNRQGPSGQGEGLARPKTDNSVFSVTYGEMNLVGENTGTIDAALASMAAFYGKKWTDGRTTLSH
jgi:hypothetical protein